LLLADEVLRLLAIRQPRVIVLRGGPGSGKTTALRHLAAVLPLQAPVRLVDDVGADGTLGSLDGCGFLLCAAGSSLQQPLAGADEFELAPWDRDALIEYLLAAHERHCAEVMRRLCGADFELFQGIPDLWQIVLEQLAANPALRDARAGLHNYLVAQLPDTDLLTRARSACLNHLIAAPENGLDSLVRLARPGFEKALLRVVRHLPVQTLLAVERITTDLHGQDDCDFLAHRLPKHLVEAVCRAIRADAPAQEHLHRLLAGPPWSHPMAASLLHGADSFWVPAEPPSVLTGAYLEGVCWPEVNLTAARLAQADLSGADLRGAVCERACLAQAVLSRANLSNACLQRVDATGADLREADLRAVRAAEARFSRARLQGVCFEGAVLTSADLEEADLRGASFVGADLTNASLVGAEIEGADFTGANLTGANLEGLPLRQACWTAACFRGARLSRCDLEGLDLPGADFRSADLRGALLTGSRMPKANFHDARLNDAGLAEVDWEGADLSGALLTGASFHLGSSRSGLVGSPIACEGSRTGFYTDDYQEQHFQAPEEIRKANLCGADLRGATALQVDFYLVDLRGARYDGDQERHFRWCRAIL
jgi:uncharacterized protein YjbI with pentapeptide repeats